MDRTLCILFLAWYENRTDVATIMALHDRMEELGVASITGHVVAIDLHCLDNDTTDEWFEGPFETKDEALSVRQHYSILNEDEHSDNYYSTISYEVIITQESLKSQLHWIENPPPRMEYVHNDDDDDIPF